MRKLSHQSHDPCVATIARETSTSSDLVKTLYDEEFAALDAQARIKQFVGVIASRKVRQLLRALRAERSGTLPQRTG